MGTNAKLTICLDMKAVAPSQYTNFTFNSMMWFGDVLVGAGDNGLVILDGELDLTTKIDSYFVPVNTDFDEPRQKRITKLGVFGYSEGNLKATIIYDGYESSYSNNSIVALGTQANQMLEFPINGVDNGRFVSVKIQNLNGADFAIDSVDANLVMMTNYPKINRESARVKKSLEFPTISCSGTVS